MDKPQAIQKIKDLLALALSSNENEATNARAFAKKLQEKFNLLDEELMDAPSFEQEKNLLFESNEFLPWKASLGFAVGKYFYCSLIQQICRASKGPELFQYFLHGDDEDIELTKTWFADFAGKCQNIINANCFGRGQLFVSSFTQGLADGIQLMLEAIDARPIRIKKEIESADKLIAISNKEIKKPDAVKENTDVKQASGSDIDGRAYIQGRYIGELFNPPMVLAEKAE